MAYNSKENSKGFSKTEKLTKKEIFIGNALKVGDRVITPIVQVFTFEKGKVWSEWMEPVAMAVIERNEKYIVMLTDPENYDDDFSDLELELDSILNSIYS